MKHQVRSSRRLKPRMAANPPKRSDPAAKRFAERSLSWRQRGQICSQDYSG
jgi:hypothetical protein